MGGALELHEDCRLVADDPGIVTGSDPVNLARRDLTFASVLVSHVQTARDDVADVLDLAAGGLDDRLDALRPAPAGLKGVPADLSAREVTSSTVVLSGLLVSSGESKLLLSTPGTSISFSWPQVD